jgi:predicted transcriptional regulator
MMKESVKPTNSIDYGMATIFSRNIRQLPIINQDNVIGIFSVSDTVKQTLSQSSQNATFLESFIKKITFKRTSQFSI